MKIRLSQFFFVLSQPKLYAHFKILSSLMFFKEAIVILYFMYYFWRNTPTYQDTDLFYVSSTYVTGFVSFALYVVLANFQQVIVPVLLYLALFVK